MHRYFLHPFLHPQIILEGKSFYVREHEPKVSSSLKSYPVYWASPETLSLKLSEYEKE
jgi:hypothetical protein